MLIVSEGYMCAVYIVEGAFALRYFSLRKTTEDSVEAERSIQEYKGINKNIQVRLLLSHFLPALFSKLAAKFASTFSDNFLPHMRPKPFNSSGLATHCSRSLSEICYQVLGVT